VWLVSRTFLAILGNIPGHHLPLFAIVLTVHVTATGTKDKMIAMYAIVAPSSAPTNLAINIARIMTIGAAVSAGLRWIMLPVRSSGCCGVSIGGGALTCVVGGAFLDLATVPLS
jgi:hypothetical protein